MIDHTGIQPGEAGVQAPVMLHFGCGNLGTGAVLPFLIRHYGNTHRIVVVQRRSTDWTEVPNDITLKIETSAHESMRFRTVVSNGGFQREIFQKALEGPYGKRLLLIPDDCSLATCEPLFATLSALHCEVIISSSMGTGQNDLANVLQECRQQSKVLLFENTRGVAWNDPEFKGRCFQVLVDRICWEVEPFRPKHPKVFCHCEEGSVRYDWSDAAQIPVVATTPPPPALEGENVDPVNVEECCFPEEDRDWFHLRKRALINAPHAVTAMMCQRLLAKRKMATENQFLAPIQEMIGREHPEWNRAMDHYLRLRAAEVAWTQPGYQPEDEVEKFEAKFCAALAVARNASRRFFLTNDILTRVWRAVSLGPTLDKHQEFVNKPFMFWDTHKGDLLRKWRWGRPADPDIVYLRNFLNDTLHEVTH